MSTTTENQHLRSNYSDDQLRDALITATELRERIFIRGTVGADGSKHWSEDQINDLHTILNVLQTLENSQDTDAGEETFSSNDVLQAASDEWQPASIDDITMTDESVLALYADGTGIQGKPYNTTDDTPDSVRIAVNGQSLFIPREDITEGRAWLYRIPAPIVHPDPTKDLVIMDAKLMFEATDMNKAGTQTAKLLHYTPYGYWVGFSVDGDALDDIRTEQIVAWTPADIVPKTEAESDG